MPDLRRFALLLVAISAALAPSAGARAQDTQRRIEIHFTPTVRAQLAIWIESSDGTIFETVRLTDAVAYRGIANRPGALQMNSGWHWPYGRREGVLPVWAHRRAEASGTTFPRVIFSGRVSEGNASSAGSIGETPNTRDDYYCLSFTGGDESLDTMSCASVFMSNKGRYLREDDLAAGYSEPWEDAARAARMRPLTTRSVYPPRRDLGDCTSCPDHADVRGFVRDAREVMPELDAVTMATPPGETPFSVVIDVPDEWPDGSYTVFVEANTEGDHAPGWDETTYPTPIGPSGRWDSWAIAYGYAYRGQPSVVYAAEIALTSSGGEFESVTPIGYGDLHGLDGELHEMNATIVDDPAGSPGSGADRLRAGSDGARLRVLVPATNICEQPDPPPDCGRECGETRPCVDPLICGPESTCVGMCDVVMQPGTPAAMIAENHREQNRSHIWAHLRFQVPASTRGVQRYEVRVGTAPITDAASFAAARAAKAATLDAPALTVPIGGEPGSEIEVDIGELSHETHYWIGVRAVDRCNAPGELAVAEITTTQINFTTVSPCFVATAAYGSPLADEIGALRRFRDRHLLSNAAGRALVDGYYAVGPSAAAWIGADEARRAAARAVLAPIVALVRALE
ncbi:MAG: DUF2271 domain-containing protein [Myxococcota bacterium]|nr:DUF2271 domain-containing protein [Myxococcota bacterium]